MTTAGSTINNDVFAVAARPEAYMQSGAKKLAQVGSEEVVRALRVARRAAPAVTAEGARRI